MTNAAANIPTAPYPNAGLSGTAEICIWKQLFQEAAAQAAPAAIVHIVGIRQKEKDLNMQKNDEPIYIS